MARVCSLHKLTGIKYVRVENEFRYAIADGQIDHKQLVKENEKPISAGFFSLSKDGFFYLQDIHSTSLKLGPLNEDANLLRNIFLDN